MRDIDLFVRNSFPVGVANASGSPAVILLMLLGGVAAVAAWLLWRPGRYTPFERILYAPVYTLCRLLWRVEILRRDPSSGAWSRAERLLADDLSEGQGGRRGAILIANHRCSLDPFFVQLAAGDRVHWMVAGEYFRLFGVGHLLRAYQAIPTNRGGVDTASTKRAMAIARAGGMVGMFPEGRINRTESDWMTLRPGAALVALRAGVPIIPIWIQGARMGSTVWSPLFLPSHVKVYIGEPNTWGLDPANRQENQSDRSLAEAWMQQVLERGMELVGRPTTVVRMAGSNWLNEDAEHSKASESDSAKDA